MARNIECGVSCHGMKCVELSDVLEEELVIIHRIMGNPYMNSHDYKYRSPSGAFLQGDSNGWVLIEFWTDNYEAINDFIRYLNEQLS